MGRLNRTKARVRRKKRVRKKIQGTSERPRLCVYRSTNHIYAQIIDDTIGRTLVEASSISKEFATKTGKDSGNKKGAALIGSAIAEKARNMGIKKVIFDRNGFLYHGRVKSLSEAARENGLEF
jgi:large subunit ribosomal protein L18